MLLNGSDMPKHRVHIDDLPTGDRGVDMTVGLMVGLIRRGARNAVVKGLTKPINGRRRAEALRKCFDVVLARIRYELDPADEELVRAPWVTLKDAKGVGDCDDMTVALGALVRSLGIPCWVKVIDWKPGVGEYTHVYLVADAGDGWAIPLDPVMGKGGYGAERWPVFRSKLYKV